MKEKRSDNPIADVIMKEENLGLACELYNDFCGAGAVRTDSEDPVFQFLEKPENIGPARIVCREYPAAINFLAKMQLLKTVLRKCQEQLQPNGKWKAVLYPEDDEKLLGARWPSLEIEPREEREEYWAFALQIDANVRKLPFKLFHGIICSAVGGQPQVMSQELQSAVKAAKDRLIETHFKLNRNKRLAINDKHYQEYTLGDDAQAQTRLLNGTLADDIAAGFMELFIKWSGNINTSIRCLVRSNRCCYVLLADAGQTK